MTAGIDGQQLSISHDEQFYYTQPPLAEPISPSPSSFAHTPDTDRSHPSSPEHLDHPITPSRTFAPASSLSSSFAQPVASASTSSFSAYEPDEMQDERVEVVFAKRRRETDQSTNGDDEEEVEGSSASKLRRKSSRMHDYATQAQEIDDDDDENVPSSPAQPQTRSLTLPRAELGHSEPASQPSTATSMASSTSSSSSLPVSISSSASSPLSNASSVSISLAQPEPELDSQQLEEIELSLSDDSTGFQSQPLPVTSSSNSAVGSAHAVVMSPQSQISRRPAYNVKSSNLEANQRTHPSMAQSLNSVPDLEQSTWLSLAQSQLAQSSQSRWMMPVKQSVRVDFDCCERRACACKPNWYANAIMSTAIEEAQRIPRTAPILVDAQAKLLVQASVFT